MASKAAVLQTCIGEPKREVVDGRYTRCDFEEWWQFHGFGLFDGRLSKEDMAGAFGAGRLYERDTATQPS